MRALKAKKAAILKRTLGRPKKEPAFTDTAPATGQLAVS